MRILLATDGSENARAAARFLSRLKLSSRDEITVLHAVSRISLPNGQDLYSDTLNEIRSELAPRILATAVEDLGPTDARVVTEIAEGLPEQRIVEAAAASDVDIVVTGARGLKGIASLFIGDVTRWVVLNSTRSVLVVKGPVPEAGEKMRILCAIDDSAYSRHAETKLSSMPFPADAEITLIHVVLPFFINVPEIFAPEIKERFVGTEKAEAVRICRSRDILEGAKEHLKGRFDSIDTLSVMGDASTEILKAAEAMRAHLIVTGCRGLRGVRRLLESVSKNVLVHSKCSVLTCRADKALESGDGRQMRESSCDPL
jgi:nucleotide-binding universal stress UspA family protein